MKLRTGGTALSIALALAACAPSSRSAPDPESGGSRRQGGVTSKGELEIIVVFDDDHWGSWRERRPERDSDDAFIEGVRGCAEVHLPAASRPDDGRWLIGIEWVPQYGGTFEAGEARSRALLPYLEAPEGLTACIAALEMPAVAIPTVALIAINTPGWVRAHGAGQPIDDPDRYWHVGVRVFEELADGSLRPAPTMMDMVMRDGARRCADDAIPLDRRPVEHGFMVTFRWDNPEGPELVRDSSGGFGTRAPRRSGMEEAVAPPEGFEDCARATVTVTQLDFVADVVAITATVEVVTEAFVRNRPGGALGHGAGTR